MKTSEQLDQLATALALAQSEMPAIEKHGKSHHGKYALLEDIIKQATPILAKNGLSIVQSPVFINETRMGMVTMIIHKSGQWIESDPMSSRLAKDDAQAAGSAISYLRRYQISPMLFISTTDDDGNAAVGNDSKTGKPLLESQLDEANQKLAELKASLDFYTGLEPQRAIIAKYMQAAGVRGKDEMIRISTALKNEHLRMIDINVDKIKRIYDQRETDGTN